MQIEDNIPIPPARSKGAREVYDALNKMVCLQSIVVQKKRLHQIYSQSKLLKKKVVIRKIHDTDTYRVWVVK